MERAVRRPLLAVATLTTAGALALSPITVTPPAMDALRLPPVTISTQAVQLTDAWTDLASNTVLSLEQLGLIFVGGSNNFPLPNPIFIAPIAAQLVINPLIYAVQLFTGQGAKIPTEIADHLSKVATIAQEVFTDLPKIIADQIQTPIFAFQTATDFVNNSADKAAALLQAPAVFLNVALNSLSGLLGGFGPIGISIIIRNALASALSTPVPVLPFKKAAAAASTPKQAAAAATSTVPASKASSARSKSNSPSSANSKRKATSANANKKPAAGHAKR